MCFSTIFGQVTKTVLEILTVIFGKVYTLMILVYIINEVDVLDYTCKCILNTIYYVGSNFGLLDQSESVF